MDKSQKHRSFLLTAWQERPQKEDTQSVWRFSMEDARGLNRRRVFTTLEEVIRYVKEKLGDETVQKDDP